MFLKVRHGPCGTARKESRPVAATQRSPCEDSLPAREVAQAAIIFDFQSKLFNVKD